MQEQVDRVYRLAYRLAYPIARRWWRLRGRHHGVSIAVWLGDTVLAVHHSYNLDCDCLAVALHGARVTTKQRFASFVKRSV